MSKKINLFVHTIPSCTQPYTLYRLHIAALHCLLRFTTSIDELLHTHAIMQALEWFKGVKNQRKKMKKYCNTI